MKRAEIDLKYKWNIEDIYKSVDDFYKDLENFSKDLNFSSFKGNLNTISSIKDCYDKLYDKMYVLEKLAVYSMMKRDEDGSLSSSLELYNLVEHAELKFAEQVSFIEPEISLLPNDKLMEFLNSNELKLYKNDLIKLIEFKPHLLSCEGEKIMALGGSVFSGYHSIFSMIDDVDLDLPILNINGKRTKITQGLYSYYMQSKDEKIRKKVFKGFYRSYEKLLNTITAVYNGNLNKDVFISKVRNFSSTLDKAMFSEGVSAQVYNNLLKYVNEGLDSLHDYVNVRKNVLGGKINMYDMYVPLVEGVELSIEYEEAYNLVLEGLKPLGQDYVNLLKKAKNDRWIDVYENDGKRSGAYSVSVYSLPHPYVLMNYTKTTHGVFTIAHELGHSLHSYFSNKNQPITTADYKIFVAEVASTVNEMLLIKYLIKTAKDLKTKKYFLNYYLEMIRTTLFRQTMFAEFEFEAHKLVESGIPATKEKLNELYYNLNKKYYGKGVVHNKEIAFEWARIPHFYTSYYVYKYATGIISAINIVENILEKGDNYVEKYFKFLSSGSTQKPVELLKIAEVDLTTNIPYEKAMNSFYESLKEFKKL